MDFFFWRKKAKTDDPPAPADAEPAVPAAPPPDNAALNPASESEYSMHTFGDMAARWPDGHEDGEDTDGDEGDGKSSGGSSGGGPKARKRGDEEGQTTRGRAGRGNMGVGGATSKGDGDAKMTDKQRKAIIRNASVQVRAMADGGDALDKASSGQFNTLDSEVKAMSGQDLYNYMSSNPAQMAKTGDIHVQQKMIADGYAKQLDVLTQGPVEAAQNASRKEVMAVLLGQPLTDMDPSQQAFVWDKLAELGEVHGRFEGDFGALENAVGSFVLSSKAGEQLVKEGHVTLSNSHSGIKGPDPGLKVSFTMAVNNTTNKPAPAYHQVLRKTMRPPGA